MYYWEGVEIEYSAQKPKTIDLKPVANLLECMEKCYALPTCTSFSYHIYSKKCVGYPNGFEGGFSGNSHTWAGVRCGISKEHYTDVETTSRNTQQHYNPS